MNQTLALDQFLHILLGETPNDLSVLNQPNSSNMTIANKQVLNFNSVDAVTRAGGFIVGSVSTTEGFSTSTTPAVHETAVSARNECARLARLNPGKNFVFLKISGLERIDPNPRVSI